MELNQLESSALRLAIAKNDIGIRNALEKFRLNLNDTTLQQSLRQVAKDTILAIQAEQDAENDNNDEEDDGDNDDDDEADVEEDNEDDEETNDVDKNLDSEIYDGFTEEDKEFLRSRGWKTNGVKATEDDVVDEEEDDVVQDEDYNIATTNHHSNALNSTLFRTNKAANQSSPPTKVN